MYSLYILQSVRNKRTYIGISGNVPKRLREHNLGEVRSTKGYSPWRLIYQENYSSKTEARKRELHLKKHSATKEVLYKRIGIL